MDDIQISLIDLTGDAEQRIAQTLRALLEPDHSVRVHGEGAAEEIENCFLSPLLEPGTYRLNGPDILFILLPDPVTETERGFIQRVGALPERPSIIAVVQEPATQEIIELFRQGVSDFVTPPFNPVDIMARVLRSAEHVRKRKKHFDAMRQSVDLKQMIGKSPAFAGQLQKTGFIANCDSTVLITGETGTGKEMFARAVHYLGPRAGKPFAPVNCGAIPHDLIENELFGHAKGAFTSAVTSENGLVHETEGGTLFLDEIDSLPLSAQVKLLRFLQEKEYRQLGSSKTRYADVRIIAATNVNIEEAVESGAFRRDLYYRLNIIPLHLPPLRERREDIPLLAEHFIHHYALQQNKEIADVTPEAVQKLLLYDWPGNIRELQNVIERAVVFSTGLVLSNEDIMLPKAEAALGEESFQQAKARIIVQFEKNYITGLLVASNGNISLAARKAKKNRRAFWELMKKHKINVGKFRFQRKSRDKISVSS